MIAMSSRTFVRSLQALRFGMIAALALGVAALSTSPASAVSSSVRNACMGDYFSYCAGMEVGSQELRRCFNRNGKKLSSGCVSALVAAGEVSQAEVSRRSGATKPTKVAKVAKKKKSTAVASRSKPAKRQYASLR